MCEDEGKLQNLQFLSSSYVFINFMTTKCALPHKNFLYNLKLKQNNAMLCEWRTSVILGGFTMTGEVITVIQPSAESSQVFESCANF